MVSKSHTLNKGEAHLPQSELAQRLCLSCFLINYNYQAEDMTLKEGVLLDHKYQFHLIPGAPRNYAICFFHMGGTSHMAFFVLPFWRSFFLFNSS
jgi:hypothetical protein